MMAVGFREGQRSLRRDYMVAELNVAFDGEVVMILGLVCFGVVFFAILADGGVDVGGLWRGGGWRLHVLCVYISVYWFCFLWSWRFSAVLHICRSFLGVS
ncbi:hypothetical protein QQ045_013053 [Rhodiola kirilowii]